MRLESLRHNASPGRWNARGMLTHLLEATERQAMSDRTCTHPGCEAPRESRWRCADHYSKGRIPCSVPGCDRKHYGKGLCQFHWTRKSEGRDLLAPKFVPTAVCTFEGCEKPHVSRGWCKTHYSRWELWGDPALSKKRPVPPPRRGSDNPTWKGEEAGYHAVHKRLQSHRGRASDYACQCGDQAAQWAYDHTDPDEKQGADDPGPYSHDLDRYIPMCHSCHVRVDQNRKLVVG